MLGTSRYGGRSLIHLQCFALNIFTRSAFTSKLACFSSENTFFKNASELAETARFELAIPFWGIHTFQACSFNHSDTSPVEDKKAEKQLKKPFVGELEHEFTKYLGACQLHLRDEKLTEDQRSPPQNFLNLFLSHVSFQNAFALLTGSTCCSSTPNHLSSFSSI